MIKLNYKIVKKERNIINSTLIIVPRGPVFIQWENTIKEKTNLKVLAITNYGFIKQTLPKFNGENKDEIFNFFENYDILLIKNTTYDVLCKNYYKFDLINSWKRLMIDEAHEIITKIPSHINYHFLWLISGTYIDLLHLYFKKCPNKKLKFQYTDTTCVSNKYGSCHVAYNGYKMKKCSKISFISETYGIPINVNINKYYSKYKNDTE